jgi:exportin-2 (importin alpha re-exporter)
MTSATFGLQTRLAASIVFKNFVMAHWDDDATPESLLPPTHRTIIKQNLVALMLSAPPAIQPQLSHALGIISKSDFPEQWPSLLPELVAQMQSGQSSHATVMGCLSTMHSIFFRYRHEYRSDPLFIEMKYVLELVAQPLTQLFTQLATQLTQAPPSSALTPAQSEQFDQLQLVLDLFLSLNSQDIPEQFEDRMPAW